ncbi:MAG: hypothetical protein AB1Z22_07870, partial [Synechococcaceae cyanobacterium]
AELRGGFRFQNFWMADSSDPCQAALTFSDPPEHYLTHDVMQAESCRSNEHRRKDCWPTE